jgi:hypothetical protein
LASPRTKKDSGEIFLASIRLTFDGSNPTLIHAKKKNNEKIEGGKVNKLIKRTYPTAFLDTISAITFPDLILKRKGHSATFFLLAEKY